PELPPGGIGKLRLPMHLLDSSRARGARARCGGSGGSPGARGEPQTGIEDLLPAVEAAELLGSPNAQDGELVLT
ncbi:MAG: hypothetical protein QN143_07470, partial [Armatimonadota bacterium]|nr:hypothetical protein [Armatimonadota bacterium]